MSELPRGVVFIGAHPDDETVMAGGTLVMLHAQGVATHVVCVTDGRGGDSSGVPSAETPDALARMRVDELRCAVAALGVATLTQLGYEDPAMGPDAQLSGFTADEDVLIAQIAAAIRAAHADVVLTHGSDGEYGHPGHVQVHRTVLRAVREQTPDVALYGVAAFVPTIEDRLWNRSDPFHLALDVTPWIEAKHTAMLCHRTQFVSFTRRRNLKTVREATRTVEAFHRHWPPVPDASSPDDPFAALLRQGGAWEPATGAA
jgi:LmbE family N-acetylglucosaminyl deacetylase